jgi:hypothetical protein
MSSGNGVVLCGQTDRHDEGSSSFRNFANAPKIILQYFLSIQNKKIEKAKEQNICKSKASWLSISH